MVQEIIPLLLRKYASRSGTGSLTIRPVLLQVLLWYHNGDVAAAVVKSTRA